ncbi:hypothetical protein GGF49_001853 [Coemansia sp. RSA 1853]|nr:hypothetical protein LPJ76_004983 [Coemansia sp. RSA 638]KAJ2543662.1 hypothetical protein GGF49_001853 [Coemansia sp. RSA 1853]
MIPLHIVEKIGHYVLPPHYRLGIEHKQLSTRQILTADLVTLMSVCRVWRTAMYSRFYQSALLRINNCEIPASRRTPTKHKIPPADSPFLQNYQSSVRELVVCIEMSALISQQGISQMSTDLTLGSVQRIIFDFIPDVDDLPEPARSNIVEASLISEVVPQNLRAVADRILATAPNARNVAFHRTMPFRASLTFSSMDFYMTKCLGVLLPQQVDGLYSLGMPVVSSVLEALAPRALRTMIARHTASKEHELELAIRNHRTLERLHTSGSRNLQISDLIVDSSSSDGTRVFPQLRHLVIEHNSEMRPESAKQPRVNPFPCLETLTCRGVFPFSSPLIFADGYLRLRHIDIELDLELLELWQRARVLDKHAFAGLSFLNLGWTRSSHRHYSLACAQRLTRTAVELSASTCVLHLFNRMGVDLSSTLQELEFSQFLQHLEVKDIMLDVDQLVGLLSRLPRLRSAAVGFQCSLECSEHGEAPEQDIKASQARLRGSSTASVRELRINAHGYRHFAKAAENAVLLADMLPSVQRMGIYSTSRSLTSELTIIDSIRKRPVYMGNEQLALVEFSMVCSWTNEPLQRGWPFKQ